MKNIYSKLIKLAVILAVIFNVGVVRSQQVVLQAFWWDFHNNNYTNQWADYLTELAPRLKAMGIDAVWIPPTIKNSGQWVGYAPFDHYDLGDKYQKGFLRTRIGSKDELLRLVAVMHANGIDVIQDVVLNHTSNAGSSTGAGGQDVSAWGNTYKNFRYASYSTPVTDESATDYLRRNGRFYKNWQNFHPNAGHNSSTGDWCADYWGPDMCYYDGAYGQSSNATYNPTQGVKYLRDGARNWMTWYKKQMGFDGYRFDAVKHFPDWALEDYLYNMQNNAGWASGTEAMFAVGEYVGGKTELDNYCNLIKNRAGTFDFGLRSAFYGVITGNGNYDLGSIPGQQQNNRVFYQGGKYVHRTVPFVNNHDTFRPTLSATGQYTGWDTGNELAAHIDPFDPRLSVVYAIAFAVDGSPQIFFEDLFNVSNGQRWTHDPKNSTQLPTRSDIENIIWCHQNLHFKDGVYNVRYQSGDHLVIDRAGKALISVNDNWSVWQRNWVYTGFAPGTRLKDYSGASAPTDIRVVDANGWADISTPPCNGTALQGRRGYAVWAPEGIGTNYNKAARTTTQEWEMDNDLGDSHANSLQQGGQLPAASTAWREVGRIYHEANKTITYNLYPSNTTQNLTIAIYKGTTSMKTQSGVGTLTGTYTPTTSGWYTIKVKNSATTNPAQKCWVKVTYQAPAVVATATADANGAIKSGDNDGDLSVYYDALAAENTQANTMSDVANVEASAKVFPNPASANSINLVVTSPTERSLAVKIYDLQGRMVHQTIAYVMAGSTTVEINAAHLSSGVYQISVPEIGQSDKLFIK